MALRAKHGTVEQWPGIGCGSRFVPWAKGASMVVELKMSTGEWQSCMADRLPAELDDELKCHHAA